MKKLVISTLFVLHAFLVFAQQPTGVSGVVLDAKTQNPLQNVVTSIVNTNTTQITGRDGKFTLKNVPLGSQILQVKSDGYKEQMLAVEIVAGQLLDLGVVVLEDDTQSTEQQISLVTITENDLGDDNSGSESTSGLLQSSRDAFQQAAAFNWGQARFRVRGLDNEYGTTMINGVAMNKIYDGRPQWGNWGGLNDATRNQEFSMGSTPSDYTFGGILGTQEINTRASIYRPGSRISFSGSNTNYNWRAMATHASGLSKNGWAFVVSASGRWADEAYFEGTTYDAKSLFISVEKRFNDKHSLNFTSIYADNKRGKNSPNTDEVNNIAGIKYNSYWGWQDGEKRNSRVKNLNEPIMMLSHYWKMNQRTTLNTNVAYQTGQIGNSRIDYQGAANPDPTYYRNLPSFFTSQYDDNGVYIGNSPENILEAQNAKFFSQPQLNWARMYELNRNTGGRSAYVLYEDRTDDTTISANSILNTQLSDNIVLNAGVNYKNLKSKNFQYMLDLLGGQFFEDKDLFANVEAGQSPEADLNNIGRTVVKGDKFGYNYNLLASTYDAFTQFKFNYRKFDFYLAQNFSRTEYQREGLYKNGIYPINSFGKSDKIIFENFGFKGGMTLKLSSRHFFDFNGTYLTKAPTLRNVYPNARLNDNATIGIDNETVFSADGSYVIRMPKVKVRLTGYFNKIKNATETSFFFAEGVLEDDGGDNDAFVAETVTDIDKKNIGGEFGLDWNITSTIRLTGAAAYGQNTYDNNPHVYVNNDGAASETNTYPVVDFGRASMKGYRVAGSPQQAYSVGLEYRDPKYWWIGVNGNYLDDSYMDISTILRTKNFFVDPLYGNGVPFPEATPERARELLKQEKFDRVRLVNLTGGKSWRIDNKTLGFFASVNNLFDEVYKTGGFEQARNANFRELNQDVSSGTPAFAPKYFYGYGRTYFVNLYLNF
jgi:hypothetical protein